MIDSNAKLRSIQMPFCTQLLVFLTEGFSLLREQPFQLCDANEVFLTHDRFYNTVRSFLQHCQ